MMFYNFYSYGGSNTPTLALRYVDSGATILGGETVIGKGCTIGGNTWIVKSIPPGTYYTTVENQQQK